MPLNFYSLILASGRLTGATEEALLRIFDTLSQGVRACEEAFNAAQASADEEYIDSTTESETLVVEAIIGTAFVLAQTEIESTAKMVKQLHDRAAKDGHTLTSTKPERWEVLKAHSPRLAGTNYTRVEVINSFANYFKHRDAWNAMWKHLKADEQRTVDVISAAGAQPLSTANLRTGLTTLGINYTEVEKVLDEMLAWKSSVIAAYRSELQSKGIL
jgi:hypothetical protein